VCFPSLWPGLSVLATLSKIRGRLDQFQLRDAIQPVTCCWTRKRDSFTPSWQAGQSLGDLGCHRCRFPFFFHFSVACWCCSHRILSNTYTSSITSTCSSHHQLDIGHSPEKQDENKNVLNKSFSRLLSYLADSGIIPTSQGLHPGWGEPDPDRAQRLGDGRAVAVRLSRAVQHLFDAARGSHRPD
jgi:hypothetical protein